MNCRGTTIQQIINGFIEFPADKIERLYQEDSTFREICEDYSECIRMRDQYASDTTDRDAPLYQQEYETLIEELGEELVAIYQGNSCSHKWNQGKSGLYRCPSQTDASIMDDCFERRSNLENPSLHGFTALPPHLVKLATDYLKVLLDGDRNNASELILQAVDDGIPIKDIYLQVFQSCQHEIGRLWQTNQISVAQEHFCSAATQLIMSQLYPQIFNSEKGQGNMVATCVGGELHEIGVRMVADFFEMDGWDTYYLGANTPAKSVLETIEARNADLLCVSATITFNIQAARNLIQQIRASEAGRDIIILVGGRPFNIAEDLWNQTGADGFGRDAQEAVDIATQLIGL